MLVLGGGCATSSDQFRGPIGASYKTPAPGGESNRAGRELAVAQRMVRAGDYSQVIPRLMQIMEHHPQTQAGIEARYFLGLTYYQLEGYNDAARYFAQYLELEPEGQYAQLARDYLASTLEDVRKKQPSQKDLQKQIEAVEQRMKSAPKDFADKLELADLFWKSGRYDQAGAQYIELLEQWPQLETDATIRQRVEKDATGAYVILSPQEVERRYAEAEPLVIYNTRSFRSGRADGWYRSSNKDTNYHVSGQVTNRGETPLKNAQVIVTIYGFGDMVYDSKTINIGPLAPAASHPFSVKFRSFDNIENVYRYECLGSFSR